MAFPVVARGGDHPRSIGVQRESESGKRQWSTHIGCSVAHGKQGNGNLERNQPLGNPTAEEQCNSVQLCTFLIEIFTSCLNDSLSSRTAPFAARHAANSPAQSEKLTIA
jgi:hypothetical protein